MSYNPTSLVHQALLRELKKEYNIDQTAADLVTINASLRQAETDISNLQSSSGSGISSRVTALESDKTTQDAAIALNTAKVGITQAQADAIVANTAKTGITTSQANAITANSAKTGITSSQAAAIVANTAKVGITTGQINAINANSLKTGITRSQSDAIVANTAKVGITTQQASDITTNNAKVGITTTQAADIVRNNAKVGITTTQASEITANTKASTNTLMGMFPNVPTTTRNVTASVGLRIVLGKTNQLGIAVRTSTGQRLSGTITLT